MHLNLDIVPSLIPRLGGVAAVSTVISYISKFIGSRNFFSVCMQVMCDRDDKKTCIKQLLGKK